MEEICKRLRKELRRRANKNLMIGVPSFLVGSLIAQTILQGDSVDPLFAAGSLILMVCGAVLLSLGIYRKILGKRHPVLEQLTHGSEQIVWVYLITVENFPFGVKVNSLSTLYLFLDDGSHHYLKLNKTLLKDLRRSLKRALPNCSFGWSQEKEQLYRANPNLLRKL